MINLRVRCLPEEVELAKKAIEEGFEIKNLRGTYADRFPLRTVRMYINVAPKVTQKLASKFGVTSKQINKAWEQSKKEGLI